MTSDNKTLSVVKTDEIRVRQVVCILLFLIHYRLGSLIPDAVLPGASSLADLFHPSISISQLYYKRNCL